MGAGSSSPPLGGCRVGHTARSQASTGGSGPAPSKDSSRPGGPWARVPADTAGAPRRTGARSPLERSRAGPGRRGTRPRGRAGEERGGRGRGAAEEQEGRGGWRPGGKACRLELRVLPEAPLLGAAALPPRLSERRGPGSSLLPAFVLEAQNGEGTGYRAETPTAPRTVEHRSSDAAVGRSPPRRGQRTTSATGLCPARVSAAHDPLPDATSRLSSPGAASVWPANAPAHSVPLLRLPFRISSQGVVIVTLSATTQRSPLTACHTHSPEADVPTATSWQKSPEVCHPLVCFTG